MTKKGPKKDLAASVRQRLLDRSRRAGEEFQRTLVRYAIERLLYRITVSEHSERFMLKGAMLFMVWAEEPHRGTRDLDLWGKGAADPDELATVFREICSVGVQDDGITFDVESITAERIREDNIYAGVRVRFFGDLSGARVPMQVDIGYGDAIDPPPVRIEYPTILDMPAPVILAYPREVVVAEKLQAMVSLGIANSRLKDFHDIAELARRFVFDGERLITAIRSTFERRGSSVPEETPAGLTPEYYEDPSRQAQWRAFLRRTAATDQSSSFDSIVEEVRRFVLPPLEAAGRAEPFSGGWPAGGPWQA